MPNPMESRGFGSYQTVKNTVTTTFCTIQDFIKSQRLHVQFPTRRDIYAAGHTCIFSSSSSLYPDNSVCSQYDRTSRTCNICAWIHLDTLYVFTLLYTVHSDVTGDFSNRSPTAPVTSQETLGSCQLERLVETGPWCARPWSRQCSILSIPVMLQMCFASVINLSI